MTGVPRVVAVVAGDPQNPVLYVVHPVGCHFGVAVHECVAAATGRRRLARQVHLVQGLQPDARLVSTLQNTLGAYHCRSERAEIRRERRGEPWSPRERPSGLHQQLATRGRHPSPHSHSFSDAPGRRARLSNSRSLQTWNTRGRVTTITFKVN